MGANIINTRKMRYTGSAMTALRTGNLNPHPDTGSSLDAVYSTGIISNRPWDYPMTPNQSPCVTKSLRHNIGHYPLTSGLAGWVTDAFKAYRPTEEVLNLVKPFATEFHELVEQERNRSTGSHDLNLVELTYQITLEVGAALLLAASENGNAVDLQVEFHSSRAARDDQFLPWGKLLTGLECDPPIIGQFPFYLMMCQSFGFESVSSQEDYVYSALTGVDWAKGKNIFSDRFRAFEKRARSALPGLVDEVSGEDRSFWRISLGYLKAMNDCENARKFTTPRTAAICHGLSDDLVIAVRGFDTIGSSYMCSDGAAFLDNPGMDSLIGSAVPNDVMDLHTDIRTGETRNLLRLLYHNGLTIDENIQTMSTIYSGMLCELFRGHKRVRFGDREDGRIAATSPPYSFSRARHRRIFETLEAYVERYPLFWEWTREITRRAKEQVTEAGMDELLVGALKRAIRQGELPESQPNTFFDTYFDMIEDGHSQIQAKSPLGVSEQLAQVVRDTYNLWHIKLLEDNKPSGWGQRFDKESDELLRRAGEILGAKNNISDEVYKFAIAYGRLSMGLPYIAYHTVDAIIMTFGVVDNV